MAMPGFRKGCNNFRCLRQIVQCWPCLALTGASTPGGTAGEVHPCHISSIKLCRIVFRSRPPRMTHDSQARATPGVVSTVRPTWRGQPAGQEVARLRRGPSLVALCACAAHSPVPWLIWWYGGLNVAVRDGSA